MKYVSKIKGCIVHNIKIFFAYYLFDVPIEFLENKKNAEYI